MDCDPAINQPIYQYFTIINNYGNNEQPRENEENNQIVYLTFNPGHDVDEEASTSNSNVFNSESQEDYNTLPSGSLDEDIKYIKLEDGTMLLTTEEKDLVEDDEDQQSKSAFDLDENDKSINCNLDYTDYEILIDAENASSSMIEMVYCDETSTANEEIEVKKEKRFKCCYDGCEKEYNTSYALTVHMRSHKGCKPYICAAEGCDKKFSTNYSLKAHIRTHTGEKPYGCTVCEKHFKTSGDLQKHIRIHTGEKPFVCPIEGCGKSFTTSNIRKVHIRSHTGERPYICEYRDCGKAFSSSTNYKNHIRIHSGEKPYVCSVPGCCKRFTEYSSLYKHNLVHQPSRPYDCAYCNQRFKQESALNMHKRVRHDVIVTHDGIEIVVQIGN